MDYDAEVTKPKKGGRPAWIEREGDGRVLYTAWLYESQLEWIKRNGGAAWLRAQIDRRIKREQRAQATRLDPNED
jgi:hypothetical protein